MTGGGYRVAPGEPLEILAATWNDLMNLVEGPRSKISGSAVLGRNTPWSPRLVVEMIRPSDAAGAIGSRCPVILRFFDSGLPDTGAGTLPEDRDPHPRGGLYFAVSPTDPDAGTDPDVVAGYPVGITLSEIKPGAAGAVAIAGLVECTVNVTDIDHQFARLDAAEDTQLVSDVSGPCRIVWYATDPPATGSQACRVLLNTGTGGGSAATSRIRDQVHIVQGPTYPADPDDPQSGESADDWFARAVYLDFDDVIREVEPAREYGKGDVSGDLTGTIYESTHRPIRKADPDDGSGIASHVIPLFIDNAPADEAGPIYYVEWPNQKGSDTLSTPATWACVSGGLVPATYVTKTIAVDNYSAFPNWKVTVS